MDTYVMFKTLTALLLLLISGIGNACEKPREFQSGALSAFQQSTKGLPLWWYIRASPQTALERFAAVTTNHSSSRIPPITEDEQTARKFGDLMMQLGRYNQSALMERLMVPQILNPMEDISNSSSSLLQAFLTGNQRDFILLVIDLYLECMSEYYHYDMPRIESIIRRFQDVSYVQESGYLFLPSITTYNTLLEGYRRNGNFAAFDLTVSKLAFNCHVFDDVTIIELMTKFEICGETEKADGWLRWSIAGEGEEVLRYPSLLKILIAYMKVKMIKPVKPPQKVDSRSRRSSGTGKLTAYLFNSVESQKLFEKFPQIVLDSQQRQQLRDLSLMMERTVTIF